MRAVITILSVFVVLWATPAAAGEPLVHLNAVKSKPKPVTSFVLAEREVEILAVTRRARADTPLRRAHLDHSETMAKVMPGYPQPAFVSFDVRLKF